MRLERSGQAEEAYPDLARLHNLLLSILVRPNIPLVFAAWLSGCGAHAQGLTMSALMEWRKKQKLCTRLWFGRMVPNGRTTKSHTTDRILT